MRQASLPIPKSNGVFCLFHPSAQPLKCFKELCSQTFSYTFQDLVLQRVWNRSWNLPLRTSWHKWLVENILSDAVAELQLMGMPWVQWMPPLTWLLKNGCHCSWSRRKVKTRGLFFAGASLHSLKIGRQWSPSSPFHTLPELLSSEGKGNSKARILTTRPTLYITDFRKLQQLSDAEIIIALFIDKRTQRS